MSCIHVNALLTEEITRSLRAGDEVKISGEIFTGRDAAHKRLCETLSRGEPLPVNLEGRIIYFVGPTPERAGEVIGSAGPTTSGRMDIYSPELIARLGLRGMIGKGPWNQGVVESMCTHGAVYFAAVGGAAALIARSIHEAKIVAYPDLGPEAIRVLTVVDFPAIVAIDSYGTSLFDIGPKAYRR